MGIGIGGQKIIRQGMGIGHKACQGLITTKFSLYCITVIVPPKPGGGGPYPAGRGAWNQFDNAMDIFQPVNKDIYDPKKIYKTKKEVIIRVELGRFHSEKTYLVPIQRANLMIKVINVLNNTKARISVGIKKLRRVMHNIKVSVSGLRRKK